MDNVDIKVPLQLDHYHEIPEMDQLNEYNVIHEVPIKRYDLCLPLDTSDVEMMDPIGIYFGFTGRFREFFDYGPMYNVLNFWCNGRKSLYSPEHQNKQTAFEATEPDQLRKGKIILPNEYKKNPLTADEVEDIPIYARTYQQEINITPERIQLFSKFFF